MTGVFPEGGATYLPAMLVLVGTDSEPQAIVVSPVNGSIIERELLLDEVIALE